MSPELLIQGTRASITLRRPEVANKLLPEDLITLRRQLDEVNARSEVLVLTLQGVGKHFCSGYDIGEIANSQNEGSSFGEMVDAIENCRAVTIAAIQGGVFGGATDMALACDFRVGGAWRVCLRSPETGADLWQGGVYTRIEEPRLLAFTFKWDESHEDGPPVQTQVTVELTAAGDRTIMDFTHEGLKSDQSLTGHRHGWASTADRLAAWLADNPD